MAIGSRRTTPTLPVIAAVVSVVMDEPRNTPCVQSNASKTRGTTAERREPKISPEIGTPAGSSQLGEIDGHCWASTVKREFGCAAGPIAGFHGRPCQSSSPAGGSGVRPSHHGSSDGVLATLVKMVFEHTIWVAFGLVFGLVFGATPKNPRSGLIARSWPLASTCIHAMSSPIVHARQPGSEETTIERLVLPEALGMAAARYVTRPSGSSTPMMSMCSASQPSWRAWEEPMRSAWHFLPRSALPP